MSARAIWKGIIHLGSYGIPVKLYSAVQDRSVHFRLLHKKDKVPVQQAMINPDTGEVVPYENGLKGYKTPNDERVILNTKDLEQLDPEASRDIEIINFLPVDLIDHRWYDRPYFLGPDGVGATDLQKDYSSSRLFPSSGVLEALAWPRNCTSSLAR